MILFVDFDRVSYPSTKQRSFHERASWMPSWSSTLRSKSASRQAGGRYSLPALCSKRSAAIPGEHPAARCHALRMEAPT